MAVKAETGMPMGWTCCYQPRPAGDPGAVWPPARTVRGVLAWDRRSRLSVVGSVGLPLPSPWPDADQDRPCQAAVVDGAVAVVEGVAESGVGLRESSP